MDAPFTLPFRRFWDWLLTHPNCIVRAGSPEAMLYDDEDLHWHFAAEDDHTLLVQLVRGKHLLGELMIEPERITYVEALPPEVEEEHVFELVSETENERFAAFFFVLAHGYEEEGSFTSARVH